MDIGIVTAVWNGYGQFVDQWLDAISKLETKPTAITIALGKDHGLYSVTEMLKKYPDLPIKFYPTHAEPLMGPMRNAAVRETKTEWIMYLSVDDVILPGAIDEFKRYEKDADYICIKWQSVATWRRGAKVLTHNPKTPKEMATLYNGNIHKLEGIHSPDVKYTNPRKPIFDDMAFVSTDEGSFLYHQIGAYIRGRFPERSPYEKDLPWVKPVTGFPE